MLTGMSSSVLEVRLNLKQVQCAGVFLSDKLLIEEQSFQQCFTIMNLFEHDIMFCFKHGRSKADFKTV